jgi:hypothetical protein
MPRLPTDKEIKRDIQEKLSVPLWPHAGRALGLQRGATYAAGKEGKIPVIDDVSRKKPVATAWLRAKLGIEKAS